MNYSGQTSVPAPNSGFVAVAAGDHHNLGLKADGSVVGWGDAYYGAIDIPAPNMDFIAVAAGVGHSLGLKSDGSIVSWGCGEPYDYGQCAIPFPNTGFVAVAAGKYHTLGLKTDGSVIAWGSNAHGQSTVPTPNAGFVAVAGGRLQSLAIRGVLDCNSNGQTDFCEIQYGGVPDVDGDGIPDECQPPVTLDMRPGACPNVVNLRSRGVVPAAIVGTERVEVTQIATETLELRRADGVGGSVSPRGGFRGRRIRVEDVAGPFVGVGCECERLGPDGIDDLSMGFSTAEMVRSLELESFSPGTSVALIVTGSMNDGTPLEASDCIVIAGGSVKPSGGGLVGGRQLRRP
jgi:hypothetical protein